MAIQLGYNLTSLRSDQISVGVDLKLARDLIRNDSIRLALAAGVLDLYTHGPSAAPLSTPFAVTTMAVPVRITGTARTLHSIWAIGASATNLTNHQGRGRAAVLFLTWGGSFQTASL